MGLESATFLSGLVATNPVSGDQKTQGDDHLRLIKAAAQATFPNADKAFYFPDATTKSADFTIAATEMNKTFYVTTAGGEVSATLPTLTSDDDGWVCHFVKTNTGTNALFIVPATGTVQSGEVSGLAKCRRVIPGHRSTAMWTGSAWFITRVPSVPVGTILDFCGATLPVGYEWPNSQTLTSASTKYPEFYSINGNSGVTPDLRGRVTPGKDNMGGSAASRVTTAGSNVDGATLLATGGLEYTQLLQANVPNYNLTINTLTVSGTVTLVLATQTYYIAKSNGTDSTTPGASDNLRADGSGAPTATFSGSIGGSLNSGGSGTPIYNMMPSIIMNKILVVE